MTAEEKDRIRSRDRGRLVKLGFNLGNGKEVHHIKYHSDNNDEDWIFDIIIFYSREEHWKWHDEHPSENYKKPSLTEEAIKKRIKACSKQVLCVETGIVYSSAHEASRQTGIHHGNISKVCLGGYGRKTAGGYHWEFVKE